MFKFSAAFAAVTFLIASLVAQTTSSKPPISADRAASLAEAGHCQEALPQLKRILGQVSDPTMKRRIGTAGVRCAMTLNDAGTAVSFLAWLNREFPHDAAILYLSSHVYSDLSIRASNELLTTAPGSPQVHELNAEALETMGKWKEAAEEYRAVLAKDSNLPGIHYRLGRLLLSEENAPESNKAAAKTEFEEELKIDPNNAGAEFVLGELARQAEQWPEAIDHCSKATKLDASFADAYIALGRAYLGAGKAAEAVPPLETAARLQPFNPVVHFQLATAYRRAGRKADADRAFLAYKEAADRSQQTKDEIKKQVSGGLAEQPQTAKPQQ
jgi:tetratricopeptide (TPR) repeat protein